MGDPLPSTETNYAGSVHVRYPPARLKPRPGFKELLSEYYQWIRHNQDRGYSAFLQSMQDTALSEKARWEIGTMIRRMDEDAHDQMQNRALKWHLILHLAREVIENRCEEAEMLKKIRNKESPLKEALGEEIPSQRLFEDLPHLPGHSFLEGKHLAQVIEAWFGLFGGILPDRAQLITLDPQVTSYVTEIVEAESVLPSKRAVKSMVTKATESQWNIIQYQLPLLKREGEFSPDFVLTGLSEKTIVLFAEK
jgi:hypothetical protein